MTEECPDDVCRADYCDIRINLLKVSREHAEIVVDEKDQVASAHTPPLGVNAWRRVLVYFSG